MAASRLPSLRTNITQVGLPDSSTFLATPLDWWFPATNISSTPLLPRIGDLFSLETDGQEKYRVNHRPKLPAKLQHARDDLLTKLTHTKFRRMSQTYLMAVHSPPVGTSGDLLAKRILSIVLLVSSKTIVTFSTAMTKHLRQFLSPSPDPEPPPSSFCPEIGSKSSWRKFWRAKIPHRARTFWWRYKRDILPCGTLRARRWGQEPKCDRDGCIEPKADKHHYVLLCDSKFWAWQFILEEHTDKPLWSDHDLCSLLSFTPPKFCINPRYNISPPQLLACCLLGVQTANNLLFHHQLSRSWNDISDNIM
ncbi:MAG: hypothetical protein J3R72DRAFT_62129 [Linnemannia gamsii]|nr:MAG: hypothetical protein J3R72DRAFT_62129 [Linnemannia gamsii]